MVGIDEQNEIEIEDDGRLFRIRVLDRLERSIRPRKRLWYEITPTGAFNVLLIDHNDNAFRYIHISPLGYVDKEIELEPARPLADYPSVEELVTQIRFEWVSEIIEDSTRMVNDNE